MAETTTLAPPARIDGRRARSARTHVQITEAWLALIEHGRHSPTASEVAHRANVGLRTLYQHFSDMGALQTAAVTHSIAAAIDDAPPPSSTIHLEQRIEAIIDRRVRVYEAAAAVIHWAERNECRSPDVAAALRRWNECYRADARATFAPEIDDGEAANDVLTVAVEAALSWCNWDHLRRRRELSRERAVEIVHRQLTSLLV